ncbi:hypothetical protein PIB30_012818, partial [Stylosanthes scabra]|nr:hypothetical protein [Stylosanthes scabra]
MARWRPPYLMGSFPLVAHPRDLDGAPAPPYFVTPTKVTAARPCHDGRTHLNEGYFGDFTFPGQGPSISQAQFDLYGEN